MGWSDGLEDRLDRLESNIGSAIQLIGKNLIGRAVLCQYQRGTIEEITNFITVVVRLPTGRVTVPFYNIELL